MTGASKQICDFYLKVATRKQTSDLSSIGLPYRLPSSPVLAHFFYPGSQPYQEPSTIWLRIVLVERLIKLGR